MSRDARKFTQNRAIKHSKKLFFQVLEYVAFCYNRLKQDNRKYSKSYCRNNTSFTFEDWLKIRFIKDYLRQLKAYFHYSSIQAIHFFSETEPDYKDMTGKTRGDRIDIFITNLGLQNYWSNVVAEDIYFVIECKRLKNFSGNTAYLTDIQKFVEREYDFRFPFTGMIGFVEKSSISIDKIIDDINIRLQKSSNITTTQELTSFEIENFSHCRLSKHIRTASRTPIEVYHLFFDYADVIIE